MARKGFRLVEVVTLLTEVTNMLASAIRKAGGNPIDTNQFYTDLQDLVRRYGTSGPELIMSNVDKSMPPPTYNLAADLLAGAVLQQQTGKSSEAWNSFESACKSTGIDQIISAFEQYNTVAVAQDQINEYDLGIDPTVVDNRQTDSSGEEEVPEHQIDRLKDFVAEKENPELGSIILANKLSQSGSQESLEMVRKHFIK